MRKMPSMRLTRNSKSNLRKRAPQKVILLEIRTPIRGCITSLRSRFHPRVPVSRRQEFFKRYMRKTLRPLDSFSVFCPGARNQGCPPQSCCAPRLPTLFDDGVERESAVRVSRGTDRHTRRHLVLPLNRLALRRDHVGFEGDKEIAGHSLPDGDIRARRAGRSTAGHNRTNG